MHSILVPLLCTSEGHTMGKCETYPNYEAKLAKILELSLCTRCAVSGHNESERYGIKGKLRFPCLLCKKKRPHNFFMFKTK